MAVDQLIRCAECGTSFFWAAGAGTDADPARCPMCCRLAPPPGRQRGVVKWFSRGKGYGFITPTEGAEVFVHRSALAAGQPFPRAGQLVEFAIGHGARGAQAEAVLVLEAEAAAVPQPQTI